MKRMTMLVLGLLVVGITVYGCAMQPAISAWTAIGSTPRCAPLSLRSLLDLRVWPSIGLTSIAGRSSINGATGASQRKE